MRNGVTCGCLSLIFTCVTPLPAQYLFTSSFARAIMEIVYGIKIEGLDDPHVRNVEEALACFTDTAVPGRYLVDIFPIMRFIPSWFPGAEWKRKALRWRDNNHEVRYKPWNLIKARLVSVSLHIKSATSSSFYIYLCRRRERLFRVWLQL